MPLAVALRLVRLVGILLVVTIQEEGAPRCHG
jgi:hypothetical protein